MIHAMHVHMDLASVYVMSNRNEKHPERKNRSSDV